MHSTASCPSTLLRPCLWLAIAGALLVVGWPPSTHAQAGFQTSVSISGTRFFVNGIVTHPGTAAEGLLLNSRMVQAIFDDENPGTVDLWAYPDTGRWDPERNLQEFIAALPTYAHYGLRAVTLNLQGGRPASGDQVWHVSAFNPDGSLKSAWLSRLDRAIRACDSQGIVVILGFFYFGQDERLMNEAAVIRGTDAITDWLVAQKYTNVLVEITNESNHSAFDHSILKPSRVHELITRVRTRSGGKLRASASLTGGKIPSDTIISASDFVLLHGNGQDAGEVAAMVATVKSLSAFTAAPKPIVFNEDSTRLANFDAAVAAGASWGYYAQGRNNYADGYQSPPVNWDLNTSAKLQFFSRVQQFMGTTTTNPPPPVDPAQSVVSFTLINADTGQPVSGHANMADGAALDLGAIGTKNLNIQANTLPAVVGSVVFGLNADAKHSVENVAPYTLAGDSGSRYEAWTPAPGTYVLTATPYSSSKGTGTPGEALTITFTVTSTGSVPTPPTPPINVRIIK